MKNRKATGKLERSSERRTANGKPEYTESLNDRKKAGTAGRIVADVTAHPVFLSYLVNADQNEIMK